MVEKGKLLLIMVLLLCTLGGCGSVTKLPDNPIVFEQGINEEYAYLSVDDKIYVPYCPWVQEYLGDCIGYYDYSGDEYTEPSQQYIYELKGFSSDEWIIEYNAEINEGMIMREINATVIPDGLTSEYEWNK